MTCPTQSSRLTLIRNRVNTITIPKHFIYVHCFVTDASHVAVPGSIHERVINSKFLLRLKLGEVLGQNLNLQFLFPEILRSAYVVLIAIRPSYGDVNLVAPWCDSIRWTNAGTGIPRRCSSPHITPKYNNYTHSSLTSYPTAVWSAIVVQQKKARHSIASIRSKAGSNSGIGQDKCY